MIALSDQIVADGSKPWCAGMEAGTATGWQYTDWVEEVMLRTTTPENYNAWINHELPFDSPEVRRGFEMTDQILSEEYVFGGLQAVMNIPQTEPFDGAFPRTAATTGMLGRRSATCTRSRPGTDLTSSRMSGQAVLAP